MYEQAFCPRLVWNYFAIFESTLSRTFNTVKYLYLKQTVAAWKLLIAGFLGINVTLPERLSKVKGGGGGRLSCFKLGISFQQRVLPICLWTSQKLMSKLYLQATRALTLPGVNLNAVYSTEYWSEGMKLQLL